MLKKIAAFFGALAFSFGIDQGSKWIAISTLLPGAAPIDLLAPFMRAQIGWNRGINFGFLSSVKALNSPYFFPLLVGILLAILLLWARRECTHAAQWGFVGLVFGGALGNLTDRLYYGAVLDFLNITCCGINNPYIFNLADCFIFLGLFGLVLFPAKRVI